MHQILHTSLGPVEYTTSGTGLPVLFFHGGHGNCHEVLWHKGFDRDHFQLITPSRPGYGQTALGENTTPETTAALFAALLDKLQVESCILIGVSAGGPSAAAFAALYPARTKALILISAVVKKWLETSDETYQRGKKLFNPRNEKLSWRAFRWFYRLAPMAAANTMFRELSTHPGKEILDEEVQELKSMLFRQSSGQGFMTDMHTEPDLNLLRKITAPSLVLHSRYDAVVSEEHQRTALQLIKDVELKSFDNRWGHLLYLGPESQEVIQRVLEFCEKNRKVYRIGRGKKLNAGLNASGI